MSALAPTAVYTPQPQGSGLLRTVLVAGGAALAAYAVYFDYKRRNDAAFRTKIRKDTRRAKTMLSAYEKAATTSSSSQGAAGAGPMGFSAADLNEPKPENPDELGQWILKQLQMGEALLAQGPEGVEPAMACFLKALLNFPNPEQLLGMLSRSLPQPIFDVLVQFYQEAVRSKAEEDKEKELQVE